MSVAFEMRMTYLDTPCGETITYRELFECSNTWKRAAAAGEPISNVPNEQASFEALLALAVEIVDPVAAHFGRPTITYGFGGQELVRKITGQIAPHLDQHACHETRGGRPICPRLGAALDFVVPGVSSLELARWIFENRAFDRIYIYGDDRPIHVSVGPEATRSVIELRRTPAGRHFPQRLRW